jgi:hypothetical protein
MLPPLFGVSWGMYAVIIAALALVLVLTLVSRRRKHASASGRAKAGPTPKSPAGRRPARGEKPAKYTQPKRSSKATTLVPAVPQTPHGAGRAGALPPLPQMTPVPVSAAPPQMPPLLPAAPAPRAHAVLMEDILPGSDPLQAMIVEVLHGWGDLTQDDTNRLLVFRIDRVMAAVAVAEIPRELKTSEYARARLAQLRRWASGLEQSEARREQAVLAKAAQPEYAGINPVQQAGLATPAMQAGPAVIAAPAVAAAPVMAAPAVSFFSPAPPVPESPETPLAPAPMQTPSAEVTSTWLQAPAPAAPMTKPAPAPAVPVAPAAVPAPGVVVAAAPGQSDMDDATRSTEAAIAAAAAAFWAGSQRRSP